MKASRTPIVANRFANARKAGADFAAKERLRGTPLYVIEALGKLARETGVDTATLIAEFDERASTREYCGAKDRQEAEAGALDDVISRFRKQLALVTDGKGSTR